MTNPIFTARSLKLVGLALALLLLQACSTQLYTKTEFQRVGQYWQDDSEAKEANVEKVHVKTWLDGDELKFDVYTYYQVQEYDYDLYYYYEQYYFPPEWATLAIPVIGWLACAMGDLHCLGHTTRWERRDTIRENERPNGVVETKLHGGVPETSHYQVDLAGTLSSGEDYQDVVPGNRIYKYRFNLKSRLQQWPALPETLRVDFKTFHDDTRYESTYTLSAEQLASMQLASDAWNTPQENRHKYFYELLTAMQAQEHTRAMRAFAKLEAMDFDKPESFWYHYAATASEVGNAELASEKAKQYLAKTKKAVYSRQAQALVDASP
ncbi:hypothetical protein [Marinobacter sp. ANT_B65]|uniref:hypothetical protein n=1 Tax=Marinobacter sp. ANT_B65 TaxID=2039467 RepID=UPI000BBEE716|nr:hypothetical protein [Marinobacter sp. ANT_B65]PCM43025.1 hypothetical protein CPA50_18230 [Marinobacter sp. ANT_B65]